MLPMILANIRTISISFFAGFVCSCFVIALYKDAVWGNVINEYKLESAKLLQEATFQAIKAERAHNEIKNRLELAHEDAKKTLDKILAENRDLAYINGGLYDPWKGGGSCKSTLPTNTKTTNNTRNSTTPNKLSNEASEFLLEFARDADRAAEYAKVCHDWSRSIESKK
jgi:hypothetical protein